MAGRFFILIGCVAEIFLLFVCCYRFLGIRIKKKSAKWVCVAVCGSLFALQLFQIFQGHTAYLVLLPLVLWGIAAVVFHDEFGVHPGYFAAAYLMMVGVEFFYVFLSEAVFAFFPESGFLLISELACQLLLVKCLNVAVFFILKRKSGKTDNQIPHKVFLVYLAVPVTSLGIMVTVFYMGLDFNGTGLWKLILVLCFLLIIAGDLLFFYIFQIYAENLNENARRRIETVYLETSFEKMDEITAVEERYAEIVHNVSHYLTAIGQLAYESGNEEICSIVEELGAKLSKGNTCAYSSHKMLNAVLSEYAEKAKTAGILFEAYVEPGVVLSHVRDTDLIAMLGNMLDNAVSAAVRKGKGASVRVWIFMQKDGKLCLMKVLNDFTGELKESDGRLLSTKEEPGLHGIGMESISKTAEKYNGFFEYYVDKEKFCAVVVLPVE